MKINFYFIGLAMILLICLNGCIPEAPLEEGQEITVEGTIIDSDGNGFHTNLCDGGWIWLIVATEKGNMSVMKGYSSVCSIPGELEKEHTEITCIEQESGNISVRGIYNKTAIEGIEGTKYFDVMPLNCTVPV